MTSYDSWLEQPYVDAAVRGDAYVAWCERGGLDPDEDHWMEFDDAQVDEWEQARLASEISRGEARREEEILRG